MSDEITMKLGITIPLKSKAVSKDWSVTSAALRRTLRSVLNCADDDVEIVCAVAGHERPDFLGDAEFKDILFVAVDFDIPQAGADGYVHSDFIFDKNMKACAGMSGLLASQAVDFWFQLDADDLLHRDFAKSLRVLPGSNGAVLDGGHRVIVGDEIERGIVLILKIDELPNRAEIVA